MEIMDLPPALNKLRSVIISSHLTTFFLILDELALKRGKAYHHQGLTSSHFSSVFDYIIFPRERNIL